MCAPKRLLQLAGVAVLWFSMPVYASFDSGHIQDNLNVARIFSGTSLTYVEFSATLPGCNSGGYITAGWADANGGGVDENRNKQVVATLMLAKAMGYTTEVRYRVNSAGTGWDNCAIDAVFLH